jgi:hypothetical protein
MPGYIDVLLPSLPQLLWLWGFSQGPHVLGRCSATRATSPASQTCLEIK